MRLLCYRLVDGSLTPAGFVEKCLKLVTLEIGSRGAALCVFKGDAPRRILHSVRAYDSVSDSFTVIPDEHEEKLPAYFHAFDTAGRVVAPDMHANQAAEDLYKGEAGTLGVTSFMSCAFSFNGRLFGSLTSYEIGARKKWDAAQLSALTRISHSATLALAQERGGRIAEVISGFEAPASERN